MSHLLKRKNVGEKIPLIIVLTSKALNSISQGKEPNTPTCSYTINNGWELKPSTLSDESQASLIPEVV